MLLLILAISAGALSLVSAVNLSDNCIGYFDRNYILATKDLNAYQECINQDPRFPDFQAFVLFLENKKYLYIPIENTSLVYLKTIVLPDQETIYRFKLTQQIKGKEHIRFVQAKQLPDGGIEFVLVGITG